MRHFGLGDGGMPQDHDTDDRNCIMTYPFIWVGAAQAPNPAGPLQPDAVRRVLDVKRAYFRQRWQGQESLWGQFTDNQYALAHRPTFCGKCNLKLRGWNIAHDAVRRSTTDRALP